jgi:HSP20 family molecular chaperone IbpA
MRNGLKSRESRSFGSAFHVGRIGCSGPAGRRRPLTVHGQPQPWLLAAHADLHNLHARAGVLVRADLDMGPTQGGGRRPSAGRGAASPGGRATVELIHDAGRTQVPPGTLTGCAAARAVAAVAVRGPKVPLRTSHRALDHNRGPRDGGQWRRCRHGGGVLAGVAGAAGDRQETETLGVAGPGTGSVITAAPGHFLQASYEEEAVMAVIRFDPFRDPLERLLSMAATGTRAPLGMPMDVYRAEDGSYHVEADLPGVDPDGVEVTVEHSTLTIRAERSPHYGESEQVVVAERPQGSFTRQLSLGEGVDAALPEAPASAPREFSASNLQSG